MANVKTNNLYTLDTVGIISETPLWISKIIFLPSAISQIVQLNSWKGLGACLAANGKVNTTGTITATTTLTSTGNMPATIAIGDVFEIYGSTGAAANLNTRNLVTTAGDTNAVVCAQAGWTNEASKSYSWRTYPGVKEIYFTAGPSDTSPVLEDWHAKPKFFLNLSLVTLGGGTLLIHLA